jgi:hypothetical protein
LMTWDGERRAKQSLLDNALAPPDSFTVRKLASILLLICFFSIGTGALEYIHNLAHAAEDAREDAQAKAAGIPVEQHHHDESNCEVHAQLHMPLIVSGWVPILVCLGLFVAFLTLLETPLIPRLLPQRIDCRGPPSLPLHASFFN